MTNKETNPSISGEEIHKEISSRMETYKDLSFMEEYAMFMGKSQILEFGLKKLLEHKYDYESEIMEKWTLGQITKKLKSNDESHG